MLLQGAKGMEDEVKSTGKPVMSGLFICYDWQNKANIEDPEGHGLSPDELKIAVKGAIEAQVAGLCLFTPERMTEAHWQAFDEAMRE